MKIICLDYDKSYTTFPELFKIIITTSKKLGYKVILATMRHEFEKDDELIYLETILDGVYYTSRQAKIPYLTGLGIIPDLFIDDCPYFLLNNA